MKAVVRAGVDIFPSRMTGPRMTESMWNRKWEGNLWGKSGGNTVKESWNMTGWLSSLASMQKQPMEQWRLAALKATITLLGRILQV
jgi:hypothetical protein